jgi:hypothetical protein
MESSVETGLTSSTLNCVCDCWVASVCPEAVDSFFLKKKP